MNTNRKKNTARMHSIIWNTVAVLILMLFMFPIYWIVVNSLKGNQEIFLTPPTLYPHKLTFEAYAAQFVSANFFSSVFNSIFIAFGALILCLVLAVPASYGLAMYKFRFQKATLLVFLVTQMLPVSLVLTPMFLMFTKAKLLNTLIAPILGNATISIPFVIVMMRPFFLSLPKSIDEAARIDGCNAFTAFIRVMIPIARSGLVTAAAFAFVFAWGDLAYSMTFNTKDALRPMTANIYYFMTKYGLQWNSIMAYGMFLVVPVVILFMMLQKHIVSGLVAGAVKE